MGERAVLDFGRRSFASRSAPVEEAPLASRSKRCAISKAPRHTTRRLPKDNDRGP